MRSSHRKCLGPFLIALVVCNSGFTISRQEAPKSEDDEMRRVMATADRFIERFHETLDFGTAFDETALPDAIMRLRRRTLADLLGLDRQFAAELDEALLVHAYKADNNFLYLRAVYNASVDGDGCVDEDKIPLPADIVTAFRESLRLRNLVDDEIGDAPKINNLLDLKRHINDLEKIAALYRKHLPANVFDTVAYKSNVKARNKNMGPQFEIKLGNEHFDVKDTTKVYIVRKEVFEIFLLEQNGMPKVLGFGN